MLELNKIADKGILVVNEDGTATFELDGEITEYTYDQFCLYLAEDSEKKSGMPYVYIGGRLTVNDVSRIDYFSIPIHCMKAVLSLLLYPAFS